MTALNLTATDDRQKTVLENLIPLVSDTLAEKINNGVYIEKDGKRLLSKKDLSTFMEYATEQAKNTIAEQQRKGAQAVCVHGDDIMSWAIHYFEEDSILGKLYNEDGTEYKPPKPVKKAKQTTPVTSYTPPAPKPKPQLSIFDMVNETAESAEHTTEITDQPDDNELIDNAETDDEVDEETENAQYTTEELQEIYEQEQTPEPVIDAKQVSQYYQCYLNIQEMYPDSIIAYRLGDFFEIFGDNAKQIANELNMTLTGRDVGLKERVPMMGMPYHAMDVYISKIISKGHKIAVVEPEGEIQTFMPSQQSKPKNKIVNSSVQSEDDILAREREIAKAFDKDALIILSDLLGDIFTLE